MTYAQLEVLLAKLYRANFDEQISILRGRYKNFQKLGLPLGRKPGRGSKSRFDIYEVLQVILAFELAEIGISPSIIAGILKIPDLSRVVDPTTGNVMSHLEIRVAEGICRGESQNLGFLLCFQLKTDCFSFGTGEPIRVFVADGIEELTSRMSKIIVIGFDDLITRITRAVIETGMPKLQP